MSRGGQIVPPVATPFLDPDGRVNEAWREFLVELWKRTGAAQEAEVQTIDGIIGGGRIGTSPEAKLDPDDGRNVDHSEWFIAAGEGLARDDDDVQTLESFEIFVDMATVEADAFPEIDQYDILAQGDHGLRRLALEDVVEAQEIEYTYRALSGDQAGGLRLVSGDQLVGEDFRVVEGDLGAIWRERPLRANNYETANRPNPVSAGAGALIYDTDLESHLFTDGESWGTFGGATTFLQLNDVPGDYTNFAGWAVVVNAGEDGLEFVELPAPGASNFLELEDTPEDYSGHAEKALAVNEAGDGIEFVDFPEGGGGGADDFTDLGDTPADYTGHGGRAVAVTDGEDGLEFVDFPSNGGGGGGGTIVSAGGLLDLGFIGWDNTTGVTAETKGTRFYLLGECRVAAITFAASLFTASRTYRAFVLELEDDGETVADILGTSDEDGDGGDELRFGFSPNVDLEAGKYYAMVVWDTTGANINSRFKNEGFGYPVIAEDIGVNISKEPEVDDTLDTASNARYAALVEVELSLASPQAFTALSDTPGNYSGHAGKVPTVNSGEDGLEFDNPGGGGEWELIEEVDLDGKAEYDVIFSDLYEYSAIRVVADKVTADSSGQRVISFSIDNGFNWIEGALYHYFEDGDDSFAEANSIFPHGSSGTGARSFIIDLEMLRRTGTKYFKEPFRGRQYAIQIDEPINALRVRNTTAAPPENIQGAMTGGKLLAFGKKAAEPQTPLVAPYRVVSSVEYGETTTHTVALPDYEVGDLLLACITLDGDQAYTISTPSGWTELFQEGESDRTSAAFYKIADGSEGESVDFTSNATARSVHAAYAIPNVEGSVEAEINNLGEGNADSTGEFPTLAPTWGTTETLWILWLGGRWDMHPDPAAAPTGYQALRMMLTGEASSDHCAAFTTSKIEETDSESPPNVNLSRNFRYVSATIGVRLGS